MAIPLAPALIAGGQLLSQGINAIAQGKMNRKTMKFSREMYARQRADALADWNMMNSYNHPSEQMKRLRESGLNPNLVYGNGATTEAGAIRGADAPAWRPETPQFDIGGAMAGSVAASQTMAVVDNLREQNKVLQQEAALKAAQTAGTIASTFLTQSNTKRSDFDLGLQTDLRDISLQAAQANLDKTYADIDATSTGTEVLRRRDEREAALNASSLREAAERILTMRAGRAKTQAEINQINHAIQNMDKDGLLKQYEIELNKQGIQKNDPMWWRSLNNYLDKITESAMPGTTPELRRGVKGKMRQQFPGIPIF